MIKLFRDKDTEKVSNRIYSKKWSKELQQAAFRKLKMLKVSESIDDLRSPPSNHLEKLSGDRQGQYSIRINKQWRICFTWEGENAYDVEIIDYH